MPATFRSALSALKFQPRSRRAHPPWPRSSDRGVPYFIYPAQRLCASQGTLWRFNPTREGRPPRRPPQCPHPNQLRVCSPRVDRAAPAAASTVPLTVLSQVSYRQISDLLNPIIHFVHFFLNKAAGCVIHTALVLRHSPDGALLHSSRSGNHFVAFSRLTNGGSVPSDWILFSNRRDDLCILPRGRDDLRVVRLSALTLTRQRRHYHSGAAGSSPLLASEFCPLTSVNFSSFRLPLSKFLPPQVSGLRSYQISKLEKFPNLNKACYYECRRNHPRN